MVDRFGWLLSTLGSLFVPCPPLLSIMSVSCVVFGGEGPSVLLDMDTWKLAKYSLTVGIVSPFIVCVADSEGDSLLPFVCDMSLFCCVECVYVC